MMGISQGVGNFSEQVWGVSVSVVTFELRAPRVGFDRR